jgi:hypothetical protein
MNREDIIRMAREAGYNAQISNEHFGSICYISQDNPDSTTEKFNRLERFATLVRKDYSFTHANIWLDRIHKATLEEREACAKLCDEAKAGRLAEQIRARGQA